LELANADGRRETVALGESPERELFWVELGTLAHETGVRVRPSWEFVHEELAAIGYAPPAVWGEAA